MSKPRHVNIIKTEHFDILFSEPSSNTAKILADNVDKIYDVAKEKIQGYHDMRIPIVISPDSDRLSVEYTSSPYNRIVLFDGVPEEKDTIFSDALLGLMYHEIYLALSQSVRSKFNQFIYKTIGGDKYQPISMIYLPFSFVEGRSFIEDGRFDDKYFLQILSVAKYEGKFPTWLQASSVRDVYPGQELNEAAGSGFAAFLMQRYGIDKYVDFWTKCGNVNFNLTAGLFEKTYGVPLAQLWQDFEDSVPLPSEENLAQIEKIKTVTKKLFPQDTEGLFENLLVTDYGFVWYDGIRHEVDIYDWNSEFNPRQMLFLASDVQKLSLSDDGRYMAVSFWGITSDVKFRDDKVWIYDLQERSFLDYDFRLRDGALVKMPEDLVNFGDFELPENCAVVAGINVKDKVSKLQFYSIDYEDNDDELILEKSFPKNYYPNSIVSAGQGKINYIVTKNNENIFYQYDFINDIEKSWNIFLHNKPIKIKNLRAFDTSKTDNKELAGQKLYSFNYIPENEDSFLRMGLIVLNENYEPVEVYFQNMDVEGGVKYPNIYGNDIYYCANKFSHYEIHYGDFGIMGFDRGSIKKGDADDQLNVSSSQPAAVLQDGKLGEYDVKHFFPIKYMINCSFMPFLAIKDLATTEEQELWPSLGATIITQDDPFKNNRIMLSGSAGYAKLDFIKLFNPKTDELNDEKKQIVDDDKKFNFGISFENTATPVDIRAGCLFKFNKEGQYNFTTKINTFWQIPIGMAFNRIKFSLLSEYTAATDYYDSNLSDHNPSLSDWPGFSDAYETGKVAFGIEYSNIHQYGISKYQQRGISVGLQLDSFWDIYEIKLLNEKHNKDKEDIKTIAGLTQAQIDKLYDESLLEISQLNIGLFGTIKIPMLNPLTMKNGLVLSLPTTVTAEVLNKTGTAVHASVESLLLGYEPQNGFPFLYLFFSRLGLKFGYDLSLNYDTYKVPLPDIRKKNSLWDVFSNVYLRDSIYFIYDMDFSAPIGRFSQYQMNFDVKGEYFIRSKSFAVSLNFNVNF